MTQAVNIYMLSRIGNDEVFDCLERHASRKEEKERFKAHEIESVRRVVNKLIECGSEINDFDDFFYGYKIPQIGKEFDLLKIGNRECLNIELKCQHITEERIKEQLVKNKHYLSHLGRQLSLYTVVTDDFACYTLNDRDELQSVEFSVLVERIRTFQADENIEIDRIFRVSDFLVSPLNTPEKFIQGEYFLTQQQEAIKKEILDGVGETEAEEFFSITGKPGTGKTLLIYDLAKTLSEHGKALVIHCGIVSQGQAVLNEVLGDRFRIMSIRDFWINQSIADHYDFILLDEAHRIYEHQFDAICAYIKNTKKICIVSFDPEQVLSRAEINRNIQGKIESLALRGRYKLSARIRTNKELITFISRIQNLKAQFDPSANYDHIEVLYANTVAEAQLIIQHYKNKGYSFINYTKSMYNPSPYDDYAENENFDTHHVIEQEFDNVLMLMDKSFYYDEQGELKACQHPTPDYLYTNLLYQGLTRAKEKLAILVVDAPELLKKIASIFENMSHTHD